MLKKIIILCIEESRRFRQQIVISGGLLGLLTIILLFLNPLSPGLTGHYYDNPEWKGKAVRTGQDLALDLRKIRDEFPTLSQNYSILWTGVIFIPISGDYDFSTASDDGSELFIDDHLVIDNSGLHGVIEQSNRISLEKGFHTIRIRYMQGAGGAYFASYWTQPGKKPESLSKALLFPKEPSDVLSFQFYRMRRMLLPILFVFWGIIGVVAIIGLFSRQMQAWQIRPVYRKLFVFFILSTLALNIFLSLLADRTQVDDSTFWQNTSTFRNNTTLYYTHFFLSSPMHHYGDSWQHMYSALEYFEDPQEKSRYSDLFFEQHVKFIYPPTSLLLFKPLMQFPVGTVISMANLVSWLAVLFSSVLIAQIFIKSMQHSTQNAISVGERWMIHILALCFTLSFYPIVRSFRLGQAQTWLYVLFVLAMWLWMRGKKGWSGICIGLICIVKPQLGLLAFWGLLRKQWHFAIAIFVASGLAGLVSLYVFGWQNHLDYLQILSYISKHGESFHPNQSINGFLNRVFFNGTNLTWDAYFYPPYHRWVHLGTTLSSVVLIVMALFWRFKQHQKAEVLDLSIAALSFTMASPLAWEHHYSFLLPIFAYALPVTLVSKQKRAGLFIMGLVFLLSTNYYQFTGLFAETSLNFLQSYLLFGAILFLVYLYRLRDTQFSS